MSALPGPNRKFKINGYELQDITFWLPNIGQVGVCVSLFSYNEKWQMGVLADKVSVSKKSVQKRTCY